MSELTLSVGSQRILAREKTFSTGSIGFNATGKVVLDGATYQVCANIIKIGSKPKLV